MKSKKTLTSVLAIGMAAAISLSGTFAWQSISQQARNEAMGTKPGGRLHDDFSGPGGTKDIYVENFGSQPIYARIRLDEYMEIGTDAGKKDGTTGNSTAVSLVTGADIDDVTTWTTHIPGADSANTGVGTESPTWADTAKTFHDYWTWTMGGQDTANNPDGKTVYMPTFNKNQDSLKADINGTLDGTAAGDTIYYDDYYAYTENETKQADAYYDADNDTTDECGPNGGPGGTGTEGTNYTETQEMHTAKYTENGKVITMTEWLALPETDPGDGGEWRGNVKAWVYDTDGWAYWSQPIAPNTATGLLLDKITQTNAPINGEWYYAINAVGQFITADDLGKDNNSGFYDNGTSAPSTNALILLGSIGVTTDGTSTPATVNIVDGGTPVAALTMAPSDTKTLTVSAPAGADTNWTWNVTTDNANGHITVSNGMVTVKAPATNGENAVITATNADTVPLTASVTITVGTAPQSVTYTAKIQEGGTDTTAENVTIGDTSGITLTASVTASDSSSVTPNWTWSADTTNAAKVSLSNTSGASTTVNVRSDASAGTTTTVTATDSTTGATASVVVTAKKALRTVNVGDVVILDDIEFVVMATNVNSNSDHALLLSKYILEEVGFDSQNHSSGGSDQYGDNVWRDSQLRTYLNSTEDSVTVSNGQNGATTTKTGWLKNKTEIQAAAVETTIYTTTEWNDATLISTTDKIFLLSQADVFGTYSYNNSDTAVTNNQMYTIGRKLDLTGNSTVTSWVANHTASDDGAAGWWWLRSPRTAYSSSYAAAGVRSGGTLGGNCGYNTTGGVRPALVVNIQNLPST